MFLISAKIESFKSINTPQMVEIDDKVTVLVGMNEAGKTVFLKALEKSNDIQNIAKFDPITDYPRKGLSQYQKQHSENPAEVTVLTYRLTRDELNDLNNELCTELASDFTFSVVHNYKNNRTILINVDEKPVLNELINESNLNSDAKKKLETAKKLRDIPKLLAGMSLTEEDKAFLADIEKRIAATTWASVVQYEVWQWLSPRIPKFLYFSDYDILPSKTNIPDLVSRVKQEKTHPLNSQHRSVLALLRMANISIDDFTDSDGYETHKANIESVSANLTDKILDFWKQNEDIEVEVDIKPDAKDEPPFNSGSNLYLRIKNPRHRVSTAFDQRSRGFVWFFSFLVWFDSVQEQVNSEKDIILLLDEPALALHALAQKDFLNYIDELSKKHQVLYTTHSPFMVHNQRLYQVRMVEDKPKIGTVISNNLSGSDPRTIFPLQAALGWTIAHNLFISKYNLLVEGASDLIYLKAVSAILEAQGRTGLKDSITIVPVGGLDNIVTFIALLGANDLKIAVLHDYRGKQEQKLQTIVNEKVIKSKAVLNASQFRDLANLGKDGKASDTEDLFEPNFYLDCFNKTFSKELKGTVIIQSELPERDRIIQRIEAFLNDNEIKLKPTAGFNHYGVASYFASNPPVSLDDDTLKRFEELFKAVNKVL